MTQSKREPFATYRPYSRGLMADGFVDGKQYAYLSVAEAKRQTQAINAAFEVRVKESVREAVEEFKARALEIAIKNGIRRIDDRRVPAEGGRDIYNEIRALPTEPEGK